MRQSAAIAYRPQGNGKAERAVQTLKRALKMYVADVNQQDCDDYAERLMFALDTAHDRVRGEMSFFLVHGRDPRSTLEAVISVVLTRRRDRDARRWAPDSDTKDRGDQQWINEDLAQTFYKKGLFLFLLDDPVMKVLSPTLIGELQGPTLEPAETPRQLEAATQLLRMLKDVGMAFNASELVDLETSVIQRSARTLHEKLEPLVGSVIQREPVKLTPTRNPENQTGSSQYASATSEAESDSSADLQRMPLGPSGAETYDPDNLNIDTPRQAVIGSAGATSAPSTTTPRIRVSAISELKEYSGKDHDEDRARSWQGKVKSAFVRDQAPDSEKCLVLSDLLTGPARNWYRQLSRSTKSNRKSLFEAFQTRYRGRGVSGMRPYYQAKKLSDAMARRPQVELFIETLDDRDPPRQLVLLRVTDSEDLEETLRAGNIFPEDIENNMAVLPEVDATTKEVTINDIRVDDPHATSEEHGRLRRIIWKRRHLLIEAGNALPPVAYGAICDIHGLLSVTIITTSTPSRASPIVVIIKANGVDIHLCIDYQVVNSLMRLMVYPMPLINDLLEDLDKALWDCSLDMASVDEDAVRVEERPQIYQRTVDNALYGHMRIKPDQDRSNPVDVFKEGEPEPELKPSVLVRRSYVDDILVTGDTWESMSNSVVKLFGICDRWDMSISVAKSYWGRRKVAYLGHEVSSAGLEAKPKELETIANLPFPTKLKGMQSFLGSLTYYSRFIEDFAVYAVILYELREADCHEIARMNSEGTQKTRADDGLITGGERDRRRVVICGDSNLVIRQMQSEMDCKAPGL
ncbi:reverse transcriptase [Phytophthora megakarya]|uniref:Reverse transcriptase n=1 Tax=Phytophthora megakarya TaxID=4795 RepID=A0A225WNG2_9STRA|nr:reverse transcriptase [Phytophthora megakarya]